MRLFYLRLLPNLVNPVDHYEAIAAMISSRLKIQKPEFKAIGFRVEQRESFHAGIPEGCQEYSRWWSEATPPVIRLPPPFFAARQGCKDLGTGVPAPVPARGLFYRH